VQRKTVREIQLSKPGNHHADLRFTTASSLRLIKVLFDHGNLITLIIDRPVVPDVLQTRPAAVFQSLFRLAVAHFEIDGLPSRIAASHES
jgi:hypothetical protein